MFGRQDWASDECIIVLETGPTASLRYVLLDKAQSKELRQPDPVGL